MQLTVFLLAIVVVTVAGHVYHSLHGHRFSGGGDWQSSVSPSIAADRSSGGTLGYANKGWGRSSGHGSNSPTSYSSDGRSKSFSGRLHYAPNNSRYADNTSFRSSW